MATFSVYDYGDTWIEWMISGLANPANTYDQFKVDITYFVGETQYPLRTDPWTDASSNNYTIYRSTGFSSSTRYGGYGYAQYASTWNWISPGLDLYTRSARPSNFSWTYAKNSGGNFNLTAAEWNAFTSKINAFRSYRGMSAYSFTSAVAGNDFTAAMFMQAVAAINAMSPPTTYIASHSGGDDIYAVYLNDIVTCLNSRD